MQAFQSRSTGEAIQIPAQTNHETGQRTILWSDIQDVFENAKFVRNGGHLVPFIKDEDYNRYVNTQRDER